MKVICTIPTYNEAENVRALVEALLAVDPALEVLVTDDASPDGTAQIVAAMARENPRVHLLLRTEDRGRGRAGRAGFVKALELGADVALELDADFSHHPRHVPALLAALERADVVLGSRHVPGGQDLGRPWWRQMLTRASNVYAGTLLGLPVKDCNSGFRAWSRKALLAVDVESAFSPGPAIVHELLYKARVAGMRLAEVPITFQERELGESTLTFAKLLRSYVTVFRLRWLGMTDRLLPGGREGVRERIEVLEPAPRRALARDATAPAPAPARQPTERDADRQRV